MTTTFVVRTAVGAPIRTFADADLALRFARNNRDSYPGIHVESETVSIITRRLWTDRMGERKAA